MVLVGLRLAERAPKLGIELGLVRQRPEEGRLEQRIHRFRTAGQDIGKPRRGAQRQRHQRHQVGVLPEQREQTAAPAHAADELIEGSERRIGVFRMRQPVEQHRQQLGKLRAGKLAAERRTGAGEPASDGRRNLQRLPEAHGPEAVEGVAVVGV